MEERSDVPAIVWHEESYTYNWLLCRVRSWLERLNAQDVCPGQVVAISGDFSPNVTALLLALIERQAIVVPLSSAAEKEKAWFLDIAEVQTIIEFGDDDRWNIQRRGASVQNPLTRALLKRHDPGLVLFSSGSTGKPKAALHNFTKLLEKFKVRRRQLRTLAFLLLDHIGGINTLFYTFSNGGTVVSVQGRSPDIVCRAVAKHRVQLLPTSPTFLNLLLLSEQYNHSDLSSLELITFGTEVMPESTLRQLNEVFPGVRLQQTYGLSEVGILRSKSRNSHSLWVKVGGEDFETKVVDGILWIRAQSAMLGYLNAPSPFDENGWFNTGDMVEVDGEYLRILGRKSDIINVGGEKVYPSEVENVLMQMDNVKDVAVFDERNTIMGQMVVARVTVLEPEDPSSVKKRIQEFCKGKLARYKIPIKVEVTTSDQFNARFKKLRPTCQK
jgi:acyl-CoA synthetase (AMP-forming)/AMP-acid ligase II